MSERLDVMKTYKLLIKGQFLRSESGRTYEVSDAVGGFLANAARASRKDVREAVVAARGAQASWWESSAYLKGQILYRWAEMAESRRRDLADLVQRAWGIGEDEALEDVNAAIDRLVWYAGWTDKIAQVYGGANPVAGPYFNFSVPRPCGVVAAIAPSNGSLQGWVDVVAAPLCAGNTVVAVASHEHPLAAFALAELTATADVPPGVLNLLTGDLAELAETLARHEDVDGLDLTGAGEFATAMAEWSADSITRTYRPHPGDDPTRRLRSFIETTTVWHTMGY
ncbi:MAG: aldehyde dehydrogenase family protein [Acidimicrobiaceae bacterium]|nr:aldehyde dehydrogenase family protein [Acidimicrobiaceae bacterium]